ncbi:MAG: putative bifunctional diguanylate cyclase/phosphodiesterase [Janthinobacterium lividum]
MNTAAERVAGELVNHKALISAMAALAQVASGDLGPRELLTHLVEIAAKHLASDGVGVMINNSGLMDFVHSSHDGVDITERLQAITQEGPSRDALLFQTDVIVDDLRDPVQTAWPDFVQRALDAGFTSMVAVPLISRGHVWGSLDLYRRQAGTWGQEELEWVHLLAHVAVSYVVMAVDRDQARHAQAELTHRSTHDGLTGLPNRILLFDRLAHALSTARRHDRVVAVFFIDLDRFKAINDTFGHAAGDTVLTTVATRVAATLRDEDTLARLAGDEFVVVCEDLPPVDPDELNEHLDAVLARLRCALAEPIRIGDLDLVISASIGVALMGDHHSADNLSADDLLADADAAMYRAKQHTRADTTINLSASAHDEHRGGASGDDAARSHAHHSSRQLERQLAQALPRKELRVHYQPITDPTGAVHAVEALLRWQHPHHGLLSAAEFIDLATANGTVVGIGQWVIDQSCAQMRLWRDQLGHRAPETVYVNLTARELADPSLSTTISTALQTHQLQPEQLGLELVETSFIDPHVLPNLHEQQRRGHPLSVDDFGTGYSSLSHLVELPVRMAKIDKKFIAGIGHDPRRTALIDAVVTVANSLNLHVIAEGVETADQARRAADAGCDYLQGFYCGGPQPAETLSLQWAGE